MRINNNYLSNIISTLFEISFVIYILLLLSEYILKDYTSNDMKLNYLLLSTIILGILSAFTNQKNVKKPKFGLKEQAYIVAIALLGTIIIYMKTKEIGWLSFIISAIGGLLIFLSSYLVINENDN